MNNLELLYNMILHSSVKDNNLKKLVYIILTFITKTYIILSFLKSN